MFETIPQFLNHWAKEQGERKALHVQDHNSEWRILTWSELLHLSLLYANVFCEQGVKAKDRVLLLDLDPHLNIPTLFGLWILGAIPLQMARSATMSFEEIKEIADRWACSWVFTNPSDAFEDQSFVAIADWSFPINEQGEISEERLKGNAENIAFLQLTSGSTGSPRAIAIGELRLCHHLASMTLSLPPAPQCLMVSWLPLYHDMGLIGGLLLTYINGSTLVTTSPKAFQRWPFIWPQLISDHKATITVAPPSAYALLARLGPRIRRKKLDFSTLKQCVIGASPIPATVLCDLQRVLGPCGLKDNVMVPAYGMAEATLSVSFPEPLSKFRIDSIEAEPFETSGQAIQGSGLEFVSVGQAIEGSELRVVGKDGVELAERRVGEIQIRSKTMMLGYVIGEDIDHLKESDWFATGDLGYIADNDLFVSGRSKELIICHGRNYFPDILEMLAGEYPGVRAGNVAAVGVDSDDKSHQYIVFVIESRLSRSEQNKLASDLREFLEGRLIPVSRIAFTGPGTLPRTTSGKLKRSTLLDKLVDLNVIDFDKPSSKRSFLDSLDKQNEIQIEDVDSVERLAKFLLQRLEKALPFTIKNISLNKSFSELGADSLTRSDLQFQVESAFDIEVPLGLFDSDKSLNEIAGLCAELRGKSVPVESARDYEKPTNIPFSPLQWRLLHTPSRDGDPHAEIVLHLRCPSNLSINSLKQALNWLAVKHQALRLRLRRERKEWVQYEGEAESSVHFERIPVEGGLSLAELGKNMVIALCDKLDMKVGPTLSAGLISKNETQSLLILCINHFVCDGWSVTVLLSDLERAYRAYSMGLVPKITSHGGLLFSEWTQHLKTLALQSSLSLLRRENCEIDETLDPFIVGEKQSITAAQLQGLKSFTNDKTRHDFFLATFLRAWADVTGLCSGLVQLESHGRGEVKGLDSRRTVGWLALHYTFPFTVDSALSAEEQREQWSKELRAMPYGGMEYCAKETYCQTPEEWMIPELHFDFRGQSFKNPNKLGLFPGIRSSSTGIPRMIQAKLVFYVNYKIADYHYSFARDPAYREENFIKSLEYRFAECLNEALADLT